MHHSFFEVGINTYFAILMSIYCCNCCKVSCIHSRRSHELKQFKVLDLATVACKVKKTIRGRGAGEFDDALSRWEQLNHCYLILLVVRIQAITSKYSREIVQIIITSLVMQSPPSATSCRSQISSGYQVEPASSH